MVSKSMEIPHFLRAFFGCAAGASGKAQNPRRRAHNSGTAVHGKRLAAGFAADRHAGNDRRQQQRNKNLRFALAQDQHACSNDRCGRAGNNTADIADDIVAERRYFPGIADQAQRILRLGHLARGHCVERNLVRRRDGDADDIKQNTGQHDADQDQKGQRKPRALQKIGRHEAHKGRDQNGRQKDQRDPSEIGSGRFSGLFLFRSSQNSLHINNYVNLYPYK